MKFSHLLTVAVSTAVALLAAEVLVRYLPPDLTVLSEIVLLVDEPIGYRLQPNARTEFTGLFESLPGPVTWAVNEQGIRSTRTVSENPPRGRRRVATFGDSETFGWSVSLQDSFQSVIEHMNPQTEVINFGVPGYNTTNVAYSMREIVPRFRPDSIVYLFNKNDFDLPLEVAQTFFDSQLLGRLRYLWQITVTKDERKRIRASEERKRVASDDLAVMAQVAQQGDADLVIAFMRWANWEDLQKYIGPDHALRRGISEGRVRIVDVEPAIGPVPRLDDHLAPGAYRQLGEALCRLPQVCDGEGVMAGDSVSIRAKSSGSR